MLPITGGSPAQKAASQKGHSHSGVGENAPREARLGLAARALALSFSDRTPTEHVAQTLAEILPFATTVRVGFRANGGVLLLSSCLLAQGGSPTIFFVVPTCPSALQECLDSGLCGFYLRSDAHKPDLHVLWRDAPHTIAALCGAVPSPGDSLDAQGCAAALLVGIRRGDNSLVSAELGDLAQALAQHLPELVAQASKEENAYIPIPDPSSALHGIQPPSSSSHTPTTSSCPSSDNSFPWGQASPSAHDAQADSLQSSRSLGRSSRVSSGSIERQLPVCPEGVSIQQDNTVWEPVENSSEQPSHGASSLDGNASHGNASTSYETDSSSNAYSSCTATREGALEQSVGIKAANEALHSSAQLSAIITEGSRSVQMGGSSDSTEQRLPAWDDLDTQNTEVNPSVAQPKSIAPAGFALFDSASSDPGTYSGAAPRGDGFKGEQAPCLTVISSESKQKRIQCIETAGLLFSSDSHLTIPAILAEEIEHIWRPDEVLLDGEYDTAEESDSSDEAPGAMPAKSGAQARRAKTSRARAQARRARAAQAQQQPESTSSSYRQWSSLEQKRGGNGSDSDSPLGGNGSPYRRRSPQHPFWLYFLDPSLETAFVAWQAQQQFKADKLSAVLVIFVLLVELAHPSLEGSALKLQACIAAIAASALYMIFMERERWQRSREALASALHCVMSGAILLFVFPAWARSLPAPKIRSLMWLFRFSGSEGCCAIPFIFMLRFKRAFWNQAFLLLASAAVSLPAVCTLSESIKPMPFCFGLGVAMEAGAFVVPLAAVRLLEMRARNLFLQSPAALLPHAD